MRPRSLIPLIIGLGVGFFAIKMGIDIVKKAKAGQGDVSGVLVTARPIEVATRITESMLVSKSVPHELMPSDAFADPKVLAGRVTAMSISAGVPITQGMLAPPGAEPGLRAKIPSGYRAVSVSVNEESAVAGFVMPGSQVDVFAGGGRDGKSELILSDVEVGAVGQSLSEVSRDGKTVRVTKSITLFLRPDQVGVLHTRAAAGGRRNLRLALRGNGKDPQERGESFWSRVLTKVLERGRSQPPVEAPSDPGLRGEQRRYVVEVVRGSDTERLVFVRSGAPGKYMLADDLLFEEEQAVGSGDPDRSSGMETDE